MQIFGFTCLSEDEYTIPHFFLLPHYFTPECTHTQDGSFPLYYASGEGYDRIVEKLLQAGAVVDMQTKVQWLRNCSGCSGFGRYTF